jgi:hypothetical protein
LLASLGGEEGQESSGSVYREQRRAECRMLGRSKALKSGPLERSMRRARWDAAALLGFEQERAS